MSTLPRLVRVQAQGRQENLKAAICASSRHYRHRFKAVDFVAISPTSPLSHTQSKLVNIDIVEHKHVRIAFRITPVAETVRSTGARATETGHSSSGHLALSSSLARFWNTSHSPCIGNDRCTVLKAISNALPPERAPLLSSNARYR